MFSGHSVPNKKCLSPDQKISPCSQHCDKIKEIEKLVCKNFEDLEIDDPVEEGIYDDYLLVCGSTNEQINDKCNREFKYRLLSLAEIEEEKNSFKIKTLCSQIFVLTMRMLLQKSCLNAWRIAE